MDSLIVLLTNKVRDKDNLAKVFTTCKIFWLVFLAPSDFIALHVSVFPDLSDCLGGTTDRNDRQNYENETQNTL